MEMPDSTEVIDLSIPLTGHMAKVYLERLNMLGSIREIRRDERSRSNTKIKAVIRQLGLQKQRDQEIPGKLAETDEQAMERKTRRLAELRRLLAAEEEAEAKGLGAPSRPPPGRSRSFVNIPDIGTHDPERVKRLEHLDRKIHSRHGALERAQSAAELRTAKLRAQTVFEPEKPFEFLWDHLPQNAMLSEKENAFFPRSLKALKEIGTGKDPRFVREMDENYKYREAMLMMEKAKGKT